MDTVAAGAGGTSGRPIRRTAASTVQLIADSAGLPGPELLNGTETGRTAPALAVAATRGAEAARSATGALAAVAAAVAGARRTRGVITPAGIAAAGTWMAAGVVAAGRAGRSTSGVGLTGRIAAAGAGLSFRRVRGSFPRAVRVRLAAFGLRGDDADDEDADDSALGDEVSSAGAAEATPIEQVAVAAPIPSATASPPTRPMAPDARIPDILVTLSFAEKFTRRSVTAGRMLLGNVMPHTTKERR